LKGENPVRFLSAPGAKFALTCPIGAQPERTVSSGLTRKHDRELQRVEARVGIEPTRKGFADLSLTTWVPRP
jgi:hypothetical protein